MAVRPARPNRRSSGVAQSLLNLFSVMLTGSHRALVVEAGAASVGESRQVGGRVGVTVEFYLGFYFARYFTQLAQAGSGTVDGGKKAVGLVQGVTQLMRKNLCHINHAKGTTVWVLQKP